MTRTNLQALSFAILSCVVGCAGTASTENAGATASATTETGIHAGTFADPDTGATLTISEVGDGHATISVVHPDATETIEGLVAIDGSSALLDEGDCKLTLKRLAKTVTVAQEGRCSDFFGSSGSWDVSGTYGEQEVELEPTEDVLGAYANGPKAATLTLVQIDERLHFSFETSKGQENGTGRLFFPQIDAEDGIATPSPDGGWQWTSDAFPECNFKITISQDKVEIAQPKAAECFGKHGGNAGYDFSGVFTR